uniref:Uncharacterized protein n=1 Tax=Phakopsora pachyrhizi TaxID=170000 RepID=A0A0S1MJB6_PHAPC
MLSFVKSSTTLLASVAISSSPEPSTLSDSLPFSWLLSLD